MKKLNRMGITSAVLIMIVGMIFILQSCDLTSQEEAFENPYTEQTAQTFDEISEAVFGNVAQNLENKAYGTVSRDDILRYANEGYIDWAQNNGVKENAFKAGLESSRRMQQYRLKSGTSSSQPAPAIMDSLLTELGLDETQKNYILQLPKIVGESGNIARLERKQDQQLVLWVGLGGQLLVVQLVV